MSVSRFLAVPFEDYQEPISKHVLAKSNTVFFDLRTVELVADRHVEWVLRRRFSSNVAIVILVITFGASLFAPDYRWRTRAS